MYTRGVAHATIYLSEELRSQVRAEQLPVSEICQRALRAELRRRKRRAFAFTNPRHPDGAARQEAA
jgi:post-segregation antitoxin (ccd killing protein)